MPRIVTRSEIDRFAGTVARRIAIRRDETRQLSLAGLLIKAQRCDFRSTCVDFVQRDTRECH